MITSTYDPNAHALTFFFSGHLDSATCMPLMPDVEKKVAEYAGPSAPLSRPLRVIFDFKDVEFISSAFIRICLTVIGKVKADNLAIQNASPLIKKILKISGLENQMAVS